MEKLLSFSAARSHNFFRLAPKSKAKKKSQERTIGGRYLLQRSLGRGGGGSVYLAKDLLAEGRPIALKCVEAASAKSEAARASLQQEFAALSLLHHPNLARVYDFGTTDRELYFTSEFVAGKNLLSASHDLDMNVLFPTLVQVLRAVDYLHRRGVLHLDLKPDNILVGDPEQGQERIPKLIDFGISEWKKQGLNAHGDFCGTPPYASPELILNQAPSPASDIYSLGMIFHLIFAGAFPFATQNPFEIMKAQVYREAKRAERLPSGVPQAFADILAKMVAHKPGDRYQSPAELLEAINLCLGENYSLRSPKAPVRILEESDHFFHAEVIDGLVAKLSSPRHLRLSLVGAPGLGKSRI